MVIVIADDFTGAAEIAGIALRYGLKVELVTAIKNISTADVLVISADTRSVDEQTAVNKLRDIFNALVITPGAFIYKKIDSVLRGHVLPEIKLMMELLNKETAFVLPANPSLGRTIEDGSYYVNGELIHTTAFFHDPEFPVKSSLVKDMLPESIVLSKDEAIPAKGIFVGEAKQVDDVQAWAGKITDYTLAVGGGDFFDALMKKRFQSASTKESVELQYPSLYIIGTRFSARTDAVKKIADDGGPVHYMGIHEATDIKAVRESLLGDGRVIFAIDPGVQEMDPVVLRNKMATDVEQILKNTEVKELLIEGGSTAGAIFNKMGWTNFIPVNEWQRGVVRMRIHELYITVKPGSYDWPAGVWNF